MFHVGQDWFVAQYILKTVCRNIYVMEQTQVLTERQSLHLVNR